MKLESSIEHRVTDWAKKQGIEHLKMTLYATSGWPDDLFLLPLRPAWIEFKRPGSKPRVLQEHRINFLRSLGYDVNWFDDPEKAIRWLSALQSKRLSEEGNSADDQAGVRGSSIRSGSR